MNEKNQIYLLGKTTKKVQTGHFERLLCSDCEQIFSAYESNFNQIWMQTIPPDFQHLATNPGKDIIQVMVPDFTLFKLFHLSVFWRAAVSAGFKFDPNINLGPYEEKLRLMLLHRNPGDYGDFPFHAQLKLTNDGKPEPTITKLAKGVDRYENFHYYMLSYAYCDWVFVVATPGPVWLVDYEKKCREKQSFLVFPVQQNQSKSFMLGVDALKEMKAQI